ncbi:MAG: hypothetical protein POELPBGB_02292 [Bacteroidia bacterium]|nr:hypothetical protein [Bacteroidia bacterium]
MAEPFYEKPFPKGAAFCFYPNGKLLGLCLKIIFAFFSEMQLQEFISKFEAELSDNIPGTITPETVFKQIDSWNSMQALIFIAMVDAEYSVTLTAENLNDCSTVSDLFSLITSKSATLKSNS